MITEHPHGRAAATSAEELAAAAADLRAALATPGAMDTLPPTLTHVGDTLDELASGMLALTETVAKSTGLADTSPDLDHLRPEARALCWHLHELASRLRAARASVETAQDWAQALAERRPSELAGVPFG